MVKNLVSRSQFARLCHVSAAAVTKACTCSLVAACSGKRIDASHPDAVAYQRHHDPARPNEPAPGIDPLYEDAIRHCQSNNRFTASNIQRGLKIGYNRAATILVTMTAAGINSDTPDAKLSTLVLTSNAPEKGIPVRLRLDE